MPGSGAAVASASPVLLSRWQPWRRSPPRRAIGARTRILDGQEAPSIAPRVDGDVLGALDVPDEAVIKPVRLTLGYAEPGARNGVSFHFGSPVIGARHEGELTELQIPTVVVRPTWVVSAAGLGADQVSRVLGGQESRVWLRPGEYLLVDHEFARHIPRVITRLPTEHTRGVMVVPATHGSVLLGPTADDAEDKYDRSTHDEVLLRVWGEWCALVPALADAHVIKSFAGLWPASDRTYWIERSQHVANVIRAGGIRSTGVSASPAVGDYVRDALVDTGLNCQPDPHAVARIPKRTRLADGLDGRAVAADPRCSPIAATRTYQPSSRRWPGAPVCRSAARAPSSPPTRSNCSPSWACGGSRLARQSWSSSWSSGACSSSRFGQRWTSRPER
jgi:glycerol-3-phosphate dehydrogenase